MEKTKGQIEGEITEAVIRFEKEYMGRGPEQTRRESRSSSAAGVRAEAAVAAVKPGADPCGGLPTAS